MFSLLLYVSLIAAIASFIGTIAYWFKLRHAAKVAPQIPLEIAFSSPLPNVSVIVPAYNEAENIQDCLQSILNSTSLAATQLEVWAIDDQSSDGTLELAQAIEQQDARLHVLAGMSRPPGKAWAGKNWACAQAADQATGEYLLFLDADVRLKPGAIEAAVQAAEREQIDLLSCGPEIICSCLAEWLVQPIIISTILLGFQFDAVNDPNRDKAFAAGPFMLFRRSAYDQIGGHRAVASQIVEDVELARRVKSSGLRLRYWLGRDLASVRMYRSWAALWEGWTKNIYLGSGRDLVGILSFALITLWICTSAWAIALLLILKGIEVGLQPLDWISLGLALTTIAWHYNLRLAGKQVSGIGTNYWWLTGLGGLAVAAIAVGSVIKTETGWGWTWRGRSLQLPDEPPEFPST